MNWAAERAPAIGSRSRDRAAAMADAEGAGGGSKLAAADRLASLELGGEGQGLEGDAGAEVRPSDGQRWLPDSLQGGQASGGGGRAAAGRRARGSTCCRPRSLAQVANDAWKQALDAVVPAVVVLKVTQTR